mmetsp:Transcript_62550/g.92995  ORF Transcript_62550/g.92995 Transcript_62550/m.92995 type:complete len:116 (-) Transcript_62550:219-566(-)
MSHLPLIFLEGSVDSPAPEDDSSFSLVPSAFFCGAGRFILLGVFSDVPGFMTYVLMYLSHAKKISLYSYIIYMYIYISLCIISMGGSEHTSLYKVLGQTKEYLGQPVFSVFVLLK